MIFGIIIYITNLLLVAVVGQLDPIFQWRYIDYVWPSEAKKQQAIQSGDYNVTEPMPMDFAVSQDKRVFISFSITFGVPARLAEVTSHIESSGPLLQPYPSWDWTNKSSCDAILQPYRIEIDECNRLWVLDSATSLKGKEATQCHPKLLVFDLWTDTLLTKISIPKKIAANARTNKSLLTNLKIETGGHFCENTTVYMADSAGNGLVIWDGSQLYRIESPTFEPQPQASSFTIASENSNMNVGILGLDLSPKLFPNEPQYLYFRPMSSYGLYAVRIHELKNNIKGQPIEIFGHDNILSSQSIAHAFSSEGTLFLSSVKEISLVCWNRYRELNRQNIVTIAQDSKRLQYADGIKVIPKNIFGLEEVWSITNRLVHHDRRNVWNISEINFRILRSPVKDLIAGTKCELPKKIRYQLKKIEHP